MYACMLKSATQIPWQIPSDDAADAKWFTIDEMKSANTEGKHVMPAVIKVIERAEAMYQAGVLQLTTTTTETVSTTNETAS